MGSLAVTSPTGHVGIEWDDESVTIDLAPPNESGANKKEREHVGSIVGKLQERGFAMTIDGKTVAKIDDALAKCKKIELKMTKPDISELLGQILNSKLVANRLLFRVDKSGKGELIQKSDLNLDGDYQAVSGLRGG